MPEGAYSAPFRPRLTFDVPDEGWEACCAQTPDSFSLGPQAAMDVMKDFTVYVPRSADKLLSPLRFE